MVRLREIQRTAAFAWSPGPGKPLLVTGTRAGAVDDEFSAESKLELWDLDLDSTDQGQELQPVASISTDSRFFDLAWGPADSDHPAGIIAGASENGSLDLWDAEKLTSGAADALISRTTKHSGAIKALQFNPSKASILATAGFKGELFVYDVKDLSSAFRLGTAAARSDDLECVAWNRKVSHILATGGAGGFVMVWDLKTKKASWTLNNRKPVSAIAWDPQNSTKLLVASTDDADPAIRLWDLRNSNAPERVLQGHEQGVLSLSWCPQDSEILLSCGKDNKTLVWNPQTGEKYGEYPEVTNWIFSTRFHPHNPSILAYASFDGKITVQTLQSTNPSANQSSAQDSVNEEDFFNPGTIQPQGPSFTLSKAPSWLACPIGASFGFGGKLVIYKAGSAAAGQKKSQILISQFTVDSDIGSATQKFEDALKSGDISSICQERMEQARTEDEKADWLVMEKLVGDNPRERIVKHLGFKSDEDTNGIVEDEPEEKEAEGGAEKTEKGDSSFFGEGADGDADGEDFLSSLAASKGVKTDNPFRLLSGHDTGIEKDITQAVLMGNFAKAADICLKENRMADAFLIANCGGPELVDKVQTTYLSQKAGVPSYLRLLGSVITKNLWDIVYNADLADWKETMAVLCTFSDPTEFPDLCESLGDRMFEQGSKKDASFCYLVGSKLEKVVSIWISELEDAEQAGLSEAGEDSTFSVHARSLQHFIEKVTVFRHATKFEDTERKMSSGWKLAPLYDKYTEYADIVAAQGQLAVAQKYLDLLPNDYPAAEVARNRVKLATQKSAAGQAAGRQPAVGSRTSSRVAPVGYQPPQPMAPAQSTGPYGMPTPPQPTNQYAPPSATPYQPSATSQYAPPVGYQPPAHAGMPSYGGAPNQFGAPPPARDKTPSIPPPSKSKNLENWNDTPMVTKPPPPRRTTPSMAPITSPFPNQQPSVGPPPASPFMGRSSPAPPPPPPKGSAPSRVMSPPQASFQQPPRPPSTAASTYAPPPPQPGAMPSPMPAVVPRTESPYNAPPAAPPPSNRYAPAPAAQQPSMPMGGMPPPPGAARPPPPNPYGPPPTQYAPPQQMAQQFGGSPAPPPGPGPMPGPAPGPPPSAAAQPTPPPPKAAAPPKQKLPAGDRSHIPADQMRIVEILERDFQRVASQAPPSFASHIKDTQKRLNFLFDHLNNGDLLQPGTVRELEQLADALAAKNYEQAQKIQVDIQRSKTDECGNWMVGVKRLISMSKNSP